MSIKTVADLRKVLRGLPGDMPVAVSEDDIIQPRAITDASKPCFGVTRPVSKYKYETVGNNQTLVLWIGKPIEGE